MSVYSNIPDKEIFPRVFEMANQIFTEFNFVRKGTHWISGNNRKIDGSEGEKHKVYYYQDRPFCLIDFTRGKKAITTYLQEQHQFLSYREVMEFLAQKVGIQLPKHILSEEQIENIKIKEKQEEFLETINDFFIDSFLTEKENFSSELKIYLEKRNYTNYLPQTQNDIHANNKMEIGFIPSRQILKEHLQKKGFNQNEVDNLFTASSIGITHKIAIPYRVLGRIVCFAFRTHLENKEPKYLYSTGERGSALFNFKPPKNNNKELIIVEGIFDALHPQVYGTNVVALGGASLKLKQIDLIQKYGYEKITLCLDNDETGLKNTSLAIEEIIKIDKKLKIYVACLPDGFKDPDELIRKKGITAFHYSINNASVWYNYYLDRLFDGINFSTITDKERDTFLEKIVSIGFKIKNPIDRNLFIAKAIESVEVFGIHSSILIKTIDRLQNKAEKEKQTGELKKGIDKTKHLIETGQEEDGIELFKNTIKQRNIELLRSSYEELFKPITREDIALTLEKEAGSFDTGLKIKGNPLLFPSGAPSFIAGRTGRGKTSALINFAVNAAKIPNGDPVVLFSYEENSRKILMKALNIYIGKSIGENNRACISGYYKKADVKFTSLTSRDEFLRMEKNFFDFLVNSGRLIIVDSKDYSDELIDKINYLHKEKQIKAVFIDYIQRINIRNSNRNSRQEELKQICNDIADCAINTGIPIIIGSQFNRQATDRDTLTLNNLSEAGDIERIANMVVAVDIKHNDLTKQESEFYMKILKNRDGMSEIYDVLTFNGNTGKISNNLFNSF